MEPPTFPRSSVNIRSIQLCAAEKLPPTAAITVKVLIQDSDSRAFLDRHGGWTHSPAEAEDFLLAVRAHDLAMRKTTGHFHILFFFPENNSFLRIMQGNGRAARQPACA